MLENRRAHFSTWPVANSSPCEQARQQPSGALLQKLRLPRQLWDFQAETISCPSSWILAWSHPQD